MPERRVHYDGHDWTVIADVDGWLGLRREHVRTWAPETACCPAGEKPKIKLRFEWKGAHCFVGPVRVGRVMSESGEYAGWIFETLIKWFPTESEARAHVEQTVTEAIMGAMDPDAFPPRESLG